MLSVAEVPQAIQILYDESKAEARRLFDSIAADLETVQIDAQTDIGKSCKGVVLYIHSGVVKYFQEDKLIRFYSAGDALVVPQTPVAGTRIVCELPVDAIRLTEAQLFARLTADAALLQTWLAYERKNGAIMLGLCSAYVPEDYKPEITMLQFQPGAIIIREGDSPDDLYEMVEGDAVVSVRGMEIGQVNEGEVFGEVSFLTGSRRSATVTARTPCTVQVIRGADFEKIARYRPALLYALSQTLARRLTDVNDRLLKISSLIQGRI